jgi:energy-converting hydrogenase A subunit P
MSQNPSKPPGLTTLDLRFESCVRSLSVWTTCTKCVEACPEQAITDDGAYKSIVVDLDRCTDCGACAATCPTDAFTAPYDIDAFVDTAESTVRCGDAGLPCIGAIATEDLLVLATRLGRVTLMDGSCAHSAIHVSVPERVAEANRVLAAMGLDASVRLEVDSAESTSNVETTDAETVMEDRRRWLFGGAGQAKRPPRGKLTQPARLDKDNLQYTQDRRWRMLARLPEGTKAVEAVVAGSEASFTSSKVFHPENCTLCTICVRICPTGALTSGRNFRDLRFDTSQCVRCGLCHEVCQTRAITLAETVSIADLLEREPKVLSRIRSRKCGECGMSYNAGANTRGLCPRCESLEQEAIELSMVRR